MSTDTTLQPVVAYANKNKILIRLAGTAAFIILGIFLTFYVEIYWLGGAFILGGLFGMGFAIYMLLNQSKPIMIIDEKGIQLRENPMAQMDLLWEEISHTTAMELHGFNTILVHLHDPEAVMDRLGFSKAKKTMQRKMVKEHGTFAMFQTQLFAQGPAEIQKVIKYYQEKVKN